MSELVQIYVDIHEKDSNIFDAISARGVGVVSGQHLETGDVLIRHNDYDVGIEIKRKADFDNSLRKNRLHNQIFRLTKSFNYPVLIVEGWQPYIGHDTEEDEIIKKMDIHKKQIRTLNRRICVIETDDQDDTVDEIERIIKDLMAGKLGVLRRKVILQDEQDPQVNLLAGLDNIGVARALELLEMFGNPQKAFENLDDWILVDGINKRRLNKIINIFKEDVPR
jgi:ERCC4-type nuclease